MKGSLILLLVLSVAASATAAPRRRGASSNVNLERILFIGAHPDDETLMSPILGKSCVEGSSHCTILLFTRGELGVCSRPGRCGDPNVRPAEAAASAAQLNSGLAIWDFPDELENIELLWNAHGGGREALLERIRAFVVADEPTVIFTFDPRHGSTCHPAHREVARLVLEAVGSERVQLIETFATFFDSGIQIRNALTSSSRRFVFAAAPSWSYMLETMHAHASQFDESMIESIAAVPESERRIVLLPATARAGATYAATCD